MPFSSVNVSAFELYVTVVFMLLNLNGHDLRDMPLIDRREILQAMIPAGGRIQSSEALTGTGAAVSTWSPRPVPKAWFRSGRIPSVRQLAHPPARPAGSNMQ